MQLPQACVSPPSLPPSPTHQDRSHAPVGAAQLPLGLPWKLLRLALKPPVILLHLVSSPLRGSPRSHQSTPRFSSPHFGSPEASPDPYPSRESSPCGRTPCKAPGRTPPPQKTPSIELCIPAAGKKPRQGGTIAAIHLRRPLDFREAAEEGYFTPPGSPGSMCSLRSGQGPRRSEDSAQVAEWQLAVRSASPSIDPGA